MGRFLGLSALALLFATSTYATQAVVNYSPVTGVSQDGTCGNGVTCVGSTYGSCCSADGVCSTVDACGDGCQPLFGICPSSVLQKRSALQDIELEKLAIEKRELEARATTSSACTSPTTSLVTCVASKTSVIKAHEANPTSFCSSWNANKPHSSSPFTAYGIASAIGVSNACSCILADAGTTTKAATTTKKSSSLTVSIAKDAVTSSALTCVSSKIAVIESMEANPTSFCSSWNANKPHSSSPFTAQGIASAIGVSNACSCILANPAQYAISTSKTSSSAALTCVASKISVIESMEANPTSFCSSWNANKPHSSSPFTAEGIASAIGVTNACSCILANPASWAITTKKMSTTTSSTSSSTSASSSACTLKERRRKRRDIAAITPAPVL
ncbi:hypothetical protein BDV97DRAFT_127103 [Delphinella strobiligena]|nr:hypothetical protein BDV97DRAFT_127103 [Delphinella strobiligena]